ncbi:serine hydrolase domain-containing protein [Maridesulfovibrio zosterae]|uniref:serine hydrolase domain-containing protein n=1 Tax=Maridesulfovibrio zosterae TaxID=82171 RepID=UPI0004131258|nr:serine hydrolase domain-containing protein [Maridesulfovibrio zosterae]
MVVQEIDNNSSFSNISLERQLDIFCKPLIKDRIDTGIVVGMFNSNDTSFYTYGYANYEKKEPMHKDTIFAIGSVTKCFVSSLLLVLEDKNLISLDDTIGNIFPKSINYRDDDVKNITLRELALHTSGLPREPKNIDTVCAGTRYAFTGHNIYEHLTSEYVYEYISNLKLNKNRLVTAQYSNLGFGILGYAISLKMNKNLSELLDQYIFKPLEMNDTTLKQPQNTDRLAKGYSGDFPIFMARNKLLQNWIFTSMMVGTGGAYSTAPDLIKFFRAHLGLSGTPLDRIFKKSRQVYASDGELSYSLGWQVDSLKRYDTSIYYKYGLIAGFSCYVGMNIPSNSAVIVLKNNFNWEDSIGHNLILRMVKNYHLKNSRYKNNLASSLPKHL